MKCRAGSEDELVAHKKARIRQCSEKINLQLVSDQKVTDRETVLVFFGSIQEQAAHKLILKSETCLRVRTI